jgi:hypothetical protein
MMCTSRQPCLTSRPGSITGIQQVELHAGHQSWLPAAMPSSCSHRMRRCALHSSRPRVQQLMAEPVVDHIMGALGTWGMAAWGMHRVCTGMPNNQCYCRVPCQHRVRQARRCNQHPDSEAFGHNSGLTRTLLGHTMCTERGVGPSLRTGYSKAPGACHDNTQNINWRLAVQTCMHACMHACMHE